MDIVFWNKRVRLQAENHTLVQKMRTGFEPVYAVLQTAARPLGYRIGYWSKNISGETQTLKRGIRSPMPFPFGDGDALPGGIEPPAYGS